MLTFLSASAFVMWTFRVMMSTGIGGKPGICLLPTSLPMPSTRTTVLGKRCHRNQVLQLLFFGL